jgi:hypothetical protein
MRRKGLSQKILQNLTVLQQYYKYSIQKKVKISIIQREEQKFIAPINTINAIVLHKNVKRIRLTLVKLLIFVVIVVVVVFVVVVYINAGYYFNQNMRRLHYFFITDKIYMRKYINSIAS